MTDATVEIVKVGSAIKKIAGPVWTGTKYAAAAITTGGLALFKTLPLWADVAILAVIALFFSGHLGMSVSRDKVTDTQIAGIASSLKNVATKSDVAELKALVATALADKPAITTGSTPKSKR